MTSDSAALSSEDRAELPYSRHLVNFRDLGGLPAGASQTRGGVLYRSDAPYAGDTPPEGAVIWPPAVVIDLRSPGEANNLYAWPATTAVHEIALLAEAAPALQTISLGELYLHVLEKSPGQLAQIATIVARADGPVLLHCSAGKDRTGVAIALLLLAVGVAPADIVADYQLTSPNVAGVIERVRALGYDLPIQTTLPKQLLATPPEALEGVLAQFAEWPGGANGWLVDHGVSAADVSLLAERLVSAE